MFEEFGKHLRELRLAKGLTKEEFCQDEKELSVRQLTRLETGKSQPKLHSLEYLAHRLGMTVSELLGEEPVAQDLPEEYLKLKYQLIRTPIYHNQDVMDALDQSLDTIYSKYYDNLPDAEQEIVDILQSSLYTYEEDGQYFREDILQKYRSHLQTCDYYNVKDLLVLYLYKNYIDEDEGQFNALGVEFYDRVTERLLISVDKIPNDYLFLLRDLLIAVTSVEILKSEFHYTEKIFEVLDEILKISQDYQKEPIVKMLKWKYSLAQEKNHEQAQFFYEDAINLAHLFGNEFLVEKLKEEWEEDNQ